MYKYLLISIVIVPVLLGVTAANNRAHGLRVLAAGWVLYSVFWVAMLYFLKHRWVG